MKVNSSCRICGGENLAKFLDLGAQPLANAFLTKEALDKTLYGKPNPESFFPLEVYFCHDCNLAQLIHVVDKEDLFKHYVYFSSGMPKVSLHWRNYANYVIENFLKSKKDFVLEIGSNDGILLRPFKEAGFKILGVDPAENIAALANENGIPTIPNFFGKNLAGEILKTHGKAKAILANNVVAHIDDHKDLFAGVKELLAPDGVFVLEAPYLVDMFENLSYDTIYHEHLSFLAIRPLRTLLSKFGLEIFDVHIVPSQGQSMRVFAGRIGKHKINPIVLELVKKETDLGFHKLESYQQLAERIRQSKINLQETLVALRLSGKTIAAYGAPAKGNTLLNYCRLRGNFLKYALEDLPSKQGLYTPGMHIPVVSREHASANPPDYYLLLAWNYKDAILEKEKEFIARGGKFIIPIGDDIKII